MRIAGLGLALALDPPAAAAGELELTLRGGPTFPFYEQRLRHDPRLPSFPVAGIRVQQSGAFELRATGGLAAGATLTWHPGRLVGIEARLDTAGLDAEATGVRFDARLELPPPLPALST